MQSFVALLRALNVGGTGKLPMSDLKAMCVELGLDEVRTYIASGNVVFKSSHNEEKLQALLEKRLSTCAGKLVGLHIRSALEMRAVLDANPFKSAATNRNMVIFLKTPPPIDTISKVTGQAGEKIVLGNREIYVLYGDGMGQSKLKIPAAKDGTARNMNTIAKLVEMTNQ
jgi:uncharacterized protein (DUF1697 family)